MNSSTVAVDLRLGRAPIGVHARVSAVLHGVVAFSLGHGCVGGVWLCWWCLVVFGCVWLCLVVFGGVE